MRSLLGKRMLQNKKGFTLVEIMIVVAIIGILAAVLIPSALNMKTDAKMAGVDTNIRAIHASLEGIMETTTGAIAMVDNLKAKIDTTLKNPITSDTTVTKNATGVAALVPASVIFYEPQTEATDVKAIVTGLDVDKTAQGAVLAIPYYDISEKFKGMYVYAIGTDGKVTTADPKLQIKKFQ